MHRRTFSALFALLCVTCFGVLNASSADKTLSVLTGTGDGSVTASAGESVELNVVIDDASTVAGASFTVTYDTANLSLNSVGSSFFGTFVDQEIPTPADQGYVNFDGTDYYSPLVENGTSAGSMLAAARVDNGTGTNVVLFQLSFTVIGSAGTYPVSITQSVINNTDAGYSASGETIPFLIGIGSEGDYPSHGVTEINPALVVVIADVDGDDIDDAWETANAPSDAADPLDVFSKNGDYDNDGYSDYQEYLNEGLYDPEGNLFDPVTKNAPDGEGYVTPNNYVNILPVILQLLQEEE